jgi:uncharacterized RmlC-like cupin family protein
LRYPGFRELSHLDEGRGETSLYLVTGVAETPVGSWLALHVLVISCINITESLAGLHSAESTIAP